MAWPCWGLMRCTEAQQFNDLPIRSIFSIVSIAMLLFFWTPCIQKLEMAAIQGWISFLLTTINVLGVILSSALWFRVRGMGERGPPRAAKALRETWESDSNKPLLETWPTNCSGKWFFLGKTMKKVLFDVWGAFVEEKEANLTQFGLWRSWLVLASCFFWELRYWHWQPHQASTSPWKNHLPMPRWQTEQRFRPWDTAKTRSRLLH